VASFAHFHDSHLGALRRSRELTHRCLPELTQAA
jgi:hypothetical protein